MEDRSLPRPVLRPLRVEAQTVEDLSRYSWVARPAYRAQLVLDAIEKRPPQKKKPFGF